jgi:hypothetical protein
MEVARILELGQAQDTGILDTPNLVFGARLLIFLTSHQVRKITYRRLVHHCCVFLFFLATQSG